MKRAVAWSLELGYLNCFHSLAAGLGVDATVFPVSEPTEAVVAGFGVSAAMRRLFASLRCLVTKALITCAATGAEPAPHPPCSHRTATTMSGLRRGAIPTNHAFARSFPVPRLVMPALWLTT